VERYRCRQTSTETRREWTGTMWKLTCEHGTSTEVNGNDYADSLARHPAQWCASCRDALVVMRCDCGKSYTTEEWRTLKIMGLVNEVEMRRCSCGVTLYLTARQARLKTRPGFYRGRSGPRGPSRRAPP